jgi:hypothetical protein
MYVNYVYGRGKKVSDIYFLGVILPKNVGLRLES